MNKKQFANHLINFDFKALFNELGWDNFANKISLAIEEEAFQLEGVVEKKGFVILLCPPKSNGEIWSNKERKQIERKTSKVHFENLIIYTDQAKSKQIWELAVKEENKPKQIISVEWHIHQDVAPLFQRLKNLLFTLDEEENITLVDVKQRISENFAKNADRITKRFYADFKKQHTAFLKFIEGIDDAIGDKENKNKQWYASLMLNRLMFCYFIQKKGFLDQNTNYLQDKLKQCAEVAGENTFYSFYRSFLLELFHDGLGRPKEKRVAQAAVDLGRIPYLNGGLFDVHVLEKQFDEIKINDEAFKKIFDFFDQWNWHLDNSEDASGKDINPDVIGYIFEKYINDRANMGAYYTKEDITEYIGKNTIIPFLFDETKRKYKEAFQPGSELWNMLEDSGDAYIYDAVKKGVPDADDIFADLPEEIKTGFRPDLENKVVSDETSPHLWEIRKPWNQRAPEEIALPTEIYRELIERRKRYADIKNKIQSGAITQINDLITYNLNIRQFTQDFLQNTEDPVFIRHFYKAIRNITVLDPTCGSGAFLFAALNILEPLYEACIMRMEQFTADEPRKHKFFEEVLAEVKSEQHPDLKYFIYKSIILHNLYGVDIMKEAVEIAKLRLFLKLVATVDVNPRKANFGLEPLPDIDFNIRAGNTLVGFATEQELLQTIQKKEQLFAGEQLAHFKEECKLVNQAFQRFKDAQLINDHSSNDFKEAKIQLQERLLSLNNELNQYLATNYGIDAEKDEKDYQAWLESHQPFHWFAQYYHILLERGGFDIIIGNPPYVEYSAIRKIYSVVGFELEKTGNLYSLTFERVNNLIHKAGAISFIVPISSVSTPRMKSLMEYLTKSFSLTFTSNFAVRPGKLFDGADMNLNIWIMKNNQDPGVFSTKYVRWYSESRNELFQNLNFVESIFSEESSSILKLYNSIEKSILDGLGKHKGVHEQLVKLNQEVDTLYYHSGGRYFRKCIFEKLSSEYKALKVPKQSKFSLSSVLSSSLYYWFWIITSDTYHVTKNDLKFFPVATNIFNNHRLSIKGEALLEDLYANAIKVDRNRKDGTRNVEVNFLVGKSKALIDDIDTLVASDFQFTEQELDFIINYDIKYRMGKDFHEENQSDV